ncbi:polysaccharide pyruvyl transferase family protein [uncultured Pseudokineococcus sp.]|uniref:polysaccharide pyruvyl transferase family protein n=1 Tax=uncultured Pseudokineococcus sp. TaxID=1642928 RepID=UPI00263A06B9|nr:polysaccharide pyruvyl transferase family protein [uncultured Pseudokineococcus sp.]
MDDTPARRLSAGDPAPGRPAPRHPDPGGTGPGRRVLVTGWFSVPDGEITAGDLLARDAAVADLRALDEPFDVAMTRTFAPDDAASVDLDTVDPERYDVVLWVCGPARGRQLQRVADRFPHARLLGVDVSVVGGVAPLHAALARDGDGEPRPDTSLIVPVPPVPVVGFCAAHAQHEYGERQRHDAVHDVVLPALASAPGPAGPPAVVPFDTRLATGEPHVPSTAAQVEALLRCFDVVVSSRLHGVVLALKNAVPVVALDPVEGGAKVAAQARALGWPVLLPHEVTRERVQEQLAWALSPEAREAARAVLPRAQEALAGSARELGALLRVPAGG